MQSQYDTFMKLPLACGIVILCLVSCPVSGAALSGTGELVYIYGGSALADFMDGLPGNGTEEEPYRLSNLRIEVERGDYGIWIENTQAYLVIEECEISMVCAPTSIGAIVLRNCRNVTVRHCYFHDNRTALRIERCQGVTIAENDIEGNHYGLVFDRFSEGNLVTRNRFDNYTNAVAHSSNSWSTSTDGNCWSDLSGSEAEYRVAAHNVDWHPSPIASCSTPADTVPPRFPPETLQTLLIEAGCALSDIRDSALAIDDRDGTVTWTSDLETIDRCQIGDQTVTYRACDSAGNCAETTRTVRVVDTVRPTISLEGPAILVAEAGSDIVALDPLGAVSDSCDREVDLVADYSAVQICRPGEYTVTYIACDRAGNCGEALRVVEIVDTTPPKIELVGPNPLLVERNAQISAIDPGVRVSESCGAGHSGEITIDYSGVDTAPPGTNNKITYRVCDRVGNCAEIERVVVVGLGTPPVPDVQFPLTFSIETWRITNEEILGVVSVHGGETLEPYLEELCVAESLLGLIRGIPSGIVVPLRFTFEMNSRYSIEGQLSADAWRALSGKEDVTALDVVLASEPLEDVEALPFGFLGLSSDLADARARTDALVRYYVDGVRAVMVKAYAESSEGRVRFLIDVLYYRPTILWPSLLVSVQSEARMIAMEIRKAVHGYADVAVSILVEDHGLLYRGATTPASTTGWHDLFVHPVLLKK